MKKFSLKLHSQSFGIGLGLLSFIFTTILLSSLVFILRGSIAAWILIVSLLIAICIMYWYLLLNKIPGRKIAISVAALLAIVVFSIFTASQTVDTSFDGNRYHKPSVGALRHGWNPLYQSISDFESSQNNPFDITDSDSQYLSPWPDPYAKGTWIFAANIYSVTGSIESGKAVNQLSVFIVFFFTLSLLSGLVGRKSALLLSFVVALNPIALQQMYSFYNDGVQGNLIITLTILLTAFTFIKQPRYNVLFTLLATGMAIAVVSNVKFTGLAYAGIVCLTYFAYVTIKRDWQAVRSLLIVGAASLIIGIGIIGSSTYVTNFIRHSNPLYPLVGKNKVDIVTHVQPRKFNQNSKVVKFLKNNLYQTSNLHLADNAEPKYKIPFTINSNEIKALSGPPDTRQAGYGVWFGGILLVTLFAGLYLIFINRKKNPHMLAAFILPLLPIGLIVLFIEGSWWARYLPQLILYPVIISVALLLANKTKTAMAIAFIILINSLHVGYLSLDYQINQRRDIRENIASNIACTDDDSTISLAYTKHYGPLYNILDLCPNTALSVSKLQTPISSRHLHIYKGVYLVNAQE